MSLLTPDDLQDPHVAQQADDALKKADEKTLTAFKKANDKAWRDHEKRVQKYKQLDDVYNGVLKPADNPNESNLHPPFVKALAQTAAANMLEDDPVLVVKPLTPLGEQMYESVEKLVTWQRDIDNFNEKLLPWYLSALKRGVAFAKVPWVQEWDERSHRLFEPSMVAPSQFVQTGVTPPQPKLVKDQPSFVVIPQEDVWWDCYADQWDDIDDLFYRTWETVDHLKELEAAGIYRNTDRLTASNETTSNPLEAQRDRVEVIEWWQRSTGKLRVIANRMHVLRDEDEPFNIAALPFVAAVPIPEPGRIVGCSLSELAGEEQAALFGLLNQVMDNVKWMTNLVVTGPSSVLDTFDRIFPGMKLPNDVGGPVEFLQPPPSIIDPAMQAMQTLRTDMQDLTGATPYASGAATATVDPKTATEFQGFSNAAQRRFLMMKQQMLYAIARAMRIWIALNRQLLARPVGVRVTGQDASTWLPVGPEAFQAEYDVEAGDASESINRAERRNEAMTLLETLAGYCGVPGFLTPQGVQVNYQFLVENAAKAWDLEKDDLLIPLPPPMPMAPMAPPAGGPLAALQGAAGQSVPAGPLAPAGPTGGAPIPGQAPAGAAPA